MAIHFVVYTFFYFYLVRPLKPGGRKYCEAAQILTSIEGYKSYYNHYRLENVSQYSVTEYTQDKWCGRKVHIY